MRFWEKIANFFGKYLYNTKWRCVVCDKEIFSGEYFCQQCKESLPKNQGAYCEHCGRKLKVSATYCSTCKGVLVNTDKARSVYVYKKPISILIQRLKYNNNQYIKDVFAEEMAFLYWKSYMNADFVTFVPMHVKAEKKRGYNQSKLLAEVFAEKTGLELVDCLEKTKLTKRQAILTREQRRKNLASSFKVTNRKIIKGKKVLLVDDVSTTGSTAEAVAERLKRAGATSVFLITVASVPPKDGY